MPRRFCDRNRWRFSAEYAGVDPDVPVVDIGMIGTQQYAIDQLLKKLSG